MGRASREKRERREQAAAGAPSATGPEARTTAPWDGKKQPGERLTITTAAWYAAIAGDPDEPLPEAFVGRGEELRHALEKGGPEAARPLVESWGLVWKVGPRGGITVDVPEAAE